MRLTAQHGFLLSLVLGGGVFLFDRAHKFYQLEIAGWTGGEYIKITSFFDYMLVWNTGISYGLLNFLPIAALLAIMGIAMTTLAIWWARAETILVRCGLAICLGGAASHIIDRWIYGAVPDFFHFHWDKWSFYVFNISDSAITIGVGLLLLDMIVPKQQRN